MWAMAQIGQLRVWSAVLECERPRFCFDGTNKIWRAATRASASRYDAPASKPGVGQPRRATLAVIRRAFEAAGVEFIDENGGGPGVRLRKRQHKKS